MKKVRCGVVGVGYLGKFHAQKYAMLPSTDLTAVADSHLHQAESVAAGFDCLTFTDYRDFIGRVDAVSIVTPTHTHHQIAAFFLSHGIHCLVEKPITSTVEEADELIALAKKNKVILQVGHLERFNSAVVGMKPFLSSPRFIESNRIAPFSLRGSDVDVVLDLMIHDIDLIRSLVNSDVKTVFANGAPVLTKHVDIANARIEFVDGTVANVTASRVGFKQERIMRIFQHDAYITVNLKDKSFAVFRKGSGEMFPGIPDVHKESYEYPEDDAIKAEIACFADSIVQGRPVAVTGEDARAALKIAHDITAIVKGNLL